MYWETLVLVLFFIATPILLACMILGLMRLCMFIEDRCKGNSQPRPTELQQMATRLERSLQRTAENSRNSRAQENVESGVPVLYYCVPVDVSGEHRQPIIRYLPANVESTYSVPLAYQQQVSNPTYTASIPNCSNVVQHPSSGSAHKVDDLPSYDEALDLATKF
ncbi:unnamed protein product [Chironomus riparius]|uniref:Uncharacterized protein n=1 Tax=Chironomus riparius TaxID=315576 RepID=A0A9P0JEY7_9DIPT|nr:unnamed protein product [Chironomus riparius]